MRSLTGQAERADGKEKERWERGKMKLGLLLRWDERRNRGGPNGKEERERRGFGVWFSFKPFSNLFSF
jgi:hypothetical protein